MGEDYCHIQLRPSAQRLVGSCAPERCSSFFGLLCLKYFHPDVPIRKLKFTFKVIGRVAFVLQRNNKYYKPKSKIVSFCSLCVFICWELLFVILTHQRTLQHIMAVYNLQHGKILFLNEFFNYSQHSNYISFRGTGSWLDIYVTYKVM